MASQISGQTALIFGGSSGIGLGVAELLASQGLNVIITSSQQSKIDAIVEKLQKANPSVKISGHAVDLLGSDVESRLEALFSQLGPLHHIIFTAGNSLTIKPLKDVDYETIIAAGHVRVFVPILVAKLGEKYLDKSSANTSITLTGGSIADKPIEGWSVASYVASSVRGLVKNLALDLSPIRVNLVSPGYVLTPLWGAGTKEEDLTAYADQTIVGRVGKPEEIAESYLYLIKSTFSTGSEISVNGGSVLK
jgi:NAD(P)-dependent dehydrogenase (short-subunit alcohol dehydrogenase family)